MQPLAPDFVFMQHSENSTFWQWMRTFVKEKLSLCDEDLKRIYEDYMIGATRESDVIFWQIDDRYRVRTGHIMQYGPDGHRLRYQNWFHSVLIKEGRLPCDFALYQCLFGQHQLRRYPSKKVAVVESEKTALVMAACYPDYLWLATCGSGGLSADKMACLKGREVTLFPDSGCYAKWCERMKLLPGLDYRISQKLESYPPNTDIADILLSDD